jgi:hypothetical protein
MFEFPQLWLWVFKGRGEKKGACLFRFQIITLSGIRS